MSLRSKLTFGLGFLFAITFALALYSSYDIEVLSNESERILKDNYDSLVYCKNMFLALDDMRTSAAALAQSTRVSFDAHLLDASRLTFERNLHLETGNITEAHERDDVQELTASYGIFASLCARLESQHAGALADLSSAYLDARQFIIKINDLNMEAVERKNQATRQVARNMILSLAAVGAVCVILAFFYFWYFPFYVSSSLSYLTGRMRALLKEAGIKLTVKTRDEALVLLQSIDLLEQRFGKNDELAN